MENAHPLKRLPDETVHLVIEVSASDQDHVKEALIEVAERVRCFWKGGAGYNTRVSYTFTVDQEQQTTHQ